MAVDPDDQSVSAHAAVMRRLLDRAPPGIRPSELRDVDFATAIDKAKWLDARARVDAMRPGPRVALLARYLRHIGNPQLRAHVLHRFVRDYIRYIRDPHGQEELADAETVLGRLLDDCDGKGTVFVTVGRAAGLDARIRGIFQKSTGDFTHVQAEVRWAGSERSPLAGADGWVLAELICEGVDLGQGAEHARHDAAGRVITTDP